ncbi:MAG: acylphosphatase [Candidatus Acidiferrales bacterium]
MEGKVAKRFFVSGIVQGVGYRIFAVRSAEQLGIRGWVKNLRDGRVEAYAIGSATALKDFRRELERGPAGAAVDDVSEEQARVDARFESGFTIEHEGR